MCPCKSKRGLRLKSEAKVLTVDDDIEMTETLSDVLTDLGHHVEMVNDGPKVIKKVKDQTFDVILMDTKMPGMNGVETFKEIKHIQPEVSVYLVLRKIELCIEVVMMTAYRQEAQNLVEEAIRQSVYSCLYKPFDPQKLIVVVEEVLAAKAKAEIQQMGGD